MPKQAVDHTGKRYGSLVALYRTNDTRRAYWMCQCDCGNIRAMRISRVVAGIAMACGCMKGKCGTRHGHAVNGGTTPTFKAWSSMRGRCNNPNGRGFKHYGGRGIQVCARWDKFENFLSDMGERPSNRHSLDRIDVNGNYEPNNCRWATNLVQNRNKTNNHVVEFRGKSQPVTAWAEEVGLPPHVIFSRLKNPKWTIERALMEPKRRRRGA